jgi:hypothetical protein
MFLELSMFSGWIVVWFLFYYINIIQFNPFPFLILAFVVGASYGVYYFIIKNAPIEVINKYIFINFGTKIVPAILIYNNPVYLNDIVFGFILGIAFLFFITVNKLDIMNEYYLFFDSMLGKNNNIYITNIIYDYYINKK